MFRGAAGGRTTLELLGLDPSPIDTEERRHEGAHRDRRVRHRARGRGAAPARCSARSTSVTVLAVVTDIPGDDAGGIEGSTESPEEAERMLEGEERDAATAIDAIVAALPDVLAAEGDAGGSRRGDAGADDRLGRRARAVRRDRRRVARPRASSSGCVMGSVSKHVDAPRAVPGARWCATSEPPRAVRHEVRRLLAGEDLARAFARDDGHAGPRRGASRCRCGGAARSAARRAAGGGPRARARRRRGRRRRSCRCSSAIASASSSTTGPRAVFTSTAVGRIEPELAARR